MITQDELRSLLEYRDGKLYWRESGPGRNSGAWAGCFRPNGYRVIRIHDHLYREHRLVWLYFHGECPPQLDHINGNPSDNRIENLRPCTPSQNVKNTRKRSDNSSGVKGVSWSRPVGKWHAYINFDNARKHLGYFSEFELAELVVEEARQLYHGEFARSA